MIVFFHNDPQRVIISLPEIKGDDMKKLLIILPFIFTAKLLFAQNVSFESDMETVTIGNMSFSIETGITTSPIVGELSQNFEIMNLNEGGHRLILSQDDAPRITIPVNIRNKLDKNARKKNILLPTIEFFLQREAKLERSKPKVLEIIEKKILVEKPIIHQDFELLKRVDLQTLPAVKLEYFECYPPKTTYDHRRKSATDKAFDYYKQSDNSRYRSNTNYYRGGKMTEDRYFGPKF